MTPLEKEIIGFNGRRESFFLDYINQNEMLNEKDKQLASKLWKEVSEFELWNHSDLNQGKKNALIFLRNNYKIDLKACEKIVNAISHVWL